MYSLLKLHWNFNLDLQPNGHHWSPLYGEKPWNVFLKNLIGSAAEHREHTVNLACLGKKPLHKQSIQLPSIIYVLQSLISQKYWDESL